MAEPEQPVSPALKGLSAFGAYLKPRPLMLGVLGFVTGIPFLLISDTLNAWLRVDGLSLQVIGFFVLVSFSYSLKFMWAPLVDRLDIPGLTAKLGHRRSWMLLLEVLIAVSLMGIACTDPRTQLTQMAALATLTGFFGATHDIVLDAWRIEVAETQADLGVLTAAYQWGYRIAFLVSGVVPLMMASRMGWPIAYAVMAAMVGLGLIVVMLAPRGAPHTPRAIHTEGMKANPVLEGIEWAGRGFLVLAAALIMGSGLTGNIDLMNGVLGHFGMTPAAQAVFKTAYTAKTTGAFFQVPFAIGGLILLLLACVPLPWKTRPGAYFKGAFIEPLADFFERYRNWAAFIFLMICVYRISEFTLNIANAYYLDLGFSLDAVGEMRKIYGVVMTMVGVAASGWLMAAMGMRTALVIGAVAGPLSHVGFIWLATRGHDLGALAIALAADNIAASIQGTVLIAYMSSLVSKDFTASQYAIFSSFYAILGKLVATQSGRIVEAAAKSAQSDGIASVFKGWMGHLTPDAYAKAAPKLGVSVEAMGAGYAAFFVYTIVVPMIAVVLALWLVYRFKPPTDGAKALS